MFKILLALAQFRDVFLNFVDPQFFPCNHSIIPILHLHKLEFQFTLLIDQAFLLTQQCRQFYFTWLHNRHFTRLQLLYLGHQPRLLSYSVLSNAIDFQNQIAHIKWMQPAHIFHQLPFAFLTQAIKPRLKIVVEPLGRRSVWFWSAWALW